ncbi:hypothetical protein Q1695_004345 [Nippostrongylus brasiliensis]|nr:hypothetical protein Q1695_004345 [Nippostrongylus brasiliensis]
MATLHLRRLLICAILLIPVRTNLQEAVDLCIRIGSRYCYFAVAAYARNNLTLNASKGRLEGDGTEALKRADKLVFEVLKTKKTKLGTAVKNALRAEKSALVRMKVDCFTLLKTLQQPQKRSIEKTCAFVYDHIGHAIHELVKALHDVEIDKTKKRTIENAYQKFIKDCPNPGKNNANDVFALAEKVLKL